MGRPLQVDYSLLRSEAGTHAPGRSTPQEAAPPPPSPASAAAPPGTCGLLPLGQSFLHCAAGPASVCAPNACLLLNQ